MAPTVLIVDDHAEFRAAAEAILEHDGWRVVGAVKDGETALAFAEWVRPDVVLVDIQLPGMDGFVVAERLATVADSPAVVLVSSREAAAYAGRLRTSSARGFIPKRSLTGGALAALVA